METLLKRDERIDKSSPKNIEYYYSFREYLFKNEFSGIENYLSDIRNLYEFYNHKDLETIGFKDINDFIKRKEYRLNTKNLIVIRLTEFLKFIKQEFGVNLSFDIDDLKGFKSTREEIENSGIRKSQPLTIVDIIKIRKTLLEFKKFSLLFTFEMIYRKGLKMRELAQCDIKKYNHETKTLKINKSLLITMEDDLDHLIVNNKVIDKKIKQETFNYHIKTIGQITFGDTKDLQHKDIHETHMNHFIPCPSCKNRVQNIPSQWAIVEYEMNNSQWMVCKKCALGGEL